MLSIFKVFLVVVMTSAALADNADSCFENAFSKCEQSKDNLLDCNAGYGGYNKDVTAELNKYLCEHIGLSYKYLHVSTNFNSFNKDRAGLRKLYMSLSDEAWEDALKLAKYITKRGGDINVKECDTLFRKSNLNDTSTEVYSLTSALGWHKKLAEDAFKIHKLVSEAHKNTYDPEVSSFVEKHFVHEHAEKIRALTGYVNDIIGLVNSDQAQYGFFLFDEHLQKLLS